MKKIFLLVLSCICYVSSIQSQSFNYQAVVRSAAGDLVTNQSIGVQIKLLRTGPSGPAIYTEIHTVSSSDQGVITLMIGYGTSEDVFVDLDWSSRNYWLEIAVDITGGTTYTVIGNSRLFSVPYANYALSGVFAKQADPDGGGNNISNTRVGATPIDEDFIFGSSQIQDISGAEDDARMFFNKSRASFRAGSVEGNFWDYSNQGSYSAAFGIDNIASGVGSFATGEENQALGINTVAIGQTNIATGDSSITMGSFLTAESIAQISLGSNNTVVSGNVDEYILTDRLFVVGNGISAAQKSDALVMLKNGNTTLNGQLTIDGDNQGAGTSYTLPAQDGTVNQVMSTDGSGNVAWTTSSSGGAFTTTSNVTSNDSGDIAIDNFVFGSTQLANDINTSDDDKRMFFDKDNAAFRAGEAQDDEWDPINLGSNSAAFGINNIASGSSSFVAGDENQAIGFTATAIGVGNIANGSSSVTLGASLKAESRTQISLGVNNTPLAGNSFLHVATDRLFVIGNGIGITPSDALVMLKNGNTTLNGQLTIDGDNAGAGASYTLPAQDGAANQVIVTDGSGNVSWVDNTTTIEAYTAATLNIAAGWQYYNAAFGVSTFQDPRYRIVDNVVYLEGLVRKNAAIINGDTIMTLPTGYRPQKTRIFSVETENGTVRVDVNPNGTVIIATGFNVTQNWVSLDGITFSVD